MVMVTNIGYHKYMEKNIPIEILTVLKDSISGLQMEEIGERLGLARHTVAKYLEILRAEGKIHYKKVGWTKLWRDISTTINIRILEMKDLEDILGIEEKIERELDLKSPERMEYLKETAAYHLQHGDPLMSLGAEIDGKLVGFVFAEIRLWEFGRGEKTGGKGVKDMMKRFKEWYESRHEYAKEWKSRTGGKVIGYFCTYAPEEMMYAAGVLPVRILGSHEPQDVTEPHIFGMYCPFCRDCLAQGLKGKYDYLDGIMIAQSCLHIRQAYTSWEMHIPVDFSYYLPMPNNVQSQRALPYLTGELKSFKEALEKWTGKNITDEDLKEGIEIMNQSRRLTMELYDLRKQDSPPLTGLEAMYTVVSSQMVDKREYNQALQELLQQLPQRQMKNGSRIRLMILGSENDDTEFVEMVESLGAVFVVDDHCTGSRYFWEEVFYNQDPLEDIAARYVNRVPCPSKDWPQRTRLDHIKRLTQDWNVQGVIVIQQKFCDPHELDIPAITKDLKQAGVPSQFLEFDVTVPVGQFKTRIEAFLEMLREEDLF